MVASTKLRLIRRNNMRGVAFHGNSVAEVVDFPDIDPDPSKY